MRPLVPLLLAPLLTVLAGCTVIPEPDEDPLARELAGRVAGEAQACVPVSQAQGLQAVDNRTLVIRTADTIWVNRLAGECPGLRPMSTLIVETFSGQYCRGDLVRGVEPGQTIPGANCPLADFVPYRRP